MEYTFKVLIKSIRYYPLKYFRETRQNIKRSVILERLSAFLNTGVTWVLLRLSEKNPSSMALLIIPVRTFEIWGRAILINFGEIWSGPVAFLGFSDFIVLVIYPSVVCLNVRDELGAKLFFIAFMLEWSTKPSCSTVLLPIWAATLM